ncbi:MAG: KpsF/GutQ family sugar-phosphate isomerase [Gammaproteobacteria bacterium]|nr:KpsF/GutQ family sugar-phosphate isomerase [Gammaproteobacteria bacterium]
MLALGRRVLEVERDAIDALCPRLGAAFTSACEVLLHCDGRVVVTGMGKSGHIGGKIAATLASTGTPAFFVHPGEASHGDLGMITRQDTVLALSYSGETAELLTIVPLIKRLGIPLIAMTGRLDSTLARAADVHLDIGVAQEACPLNLAPTASTTATLALGDALAVALLQCRGFTASDFARSHPGGVLGRRLLLTVADLMHRGERLPRVAPDAPLTEALLEMTRKGLGMTAVVDAGQHVLGVFTDGDLRRVLDAGADVRRVSIGEVMTGGGKRIAAERLAAEAVNLMQQHQITALLVTGDDGHLVGVIHMHDLLRAGVV